MRSTRTVKIHFGARRRKPSPTVIATVLGTLVIAGMLFLSWWFFVPDPTSLTPLTTAQQEQSLAAMRADLHVSQPQAGWNAGVVDVSWLTYRGHCATFGEDYGCGTWHAKVLLSDGTTAILDSPPDDHGLFLLAVPGSWVVWQPAKPITEKTVVVYGGAG